MLRNLSDLSTFRNSLFAVFVLLFLSYNPSMSTKRTYQPSRARRTKTYGFRARSRSRGGRKVIKRRLFKGRKRLIP